MKTITVNDVRSRLRSRRRIRGIAVGSLFLVLSGLVAAWVYEVTHRPRLTPMLTVAVTDYSWPIDPNPWAVEDIQRIGLLNEQTLRVRDLSADWRGRELALKRLDRDLQAVVGSAGASGTIIFYLSLHGVVDSDGEPHFLPADASPFESSTWIPVRDVLDRISDRVPKQVNKLLLLDCNRFAQNWKIGQLHNTFADRLAGVLDPQRHANTVIVNSVSSGQTGLSGAAMAGSLFGNLVADGLGGMASGGEGQVSLTRLVDFLHREMTQWCQVHGLPPQSVLQVPSTSRDFGVTWSLPESTISRLRDERPSASAPSVSSEDRDELWRRMGELPLRPLLAIAPEAVHDLEHQLLWLENICSAGHAYDRDASTRWAGLRRRLERISELIRSDGSRLSPVALRTAIVDGGSAAAQGASLPSLRLAGVLGSISADVVDAGERSWDGLIAELTPDRLKAMIDEPVATDLDRIHFLRLLDRYRVLDRWSRIDPIAATLRLRAANERSSVMLHGAVGHELRAAPWLIRSSATAEQARLILEDLVFSGQDTGGSEVDDQLATARDAQDAAQKRLADVARAFEVADDATHRLPYFAEAIAKLPVGSTFGLGDPNDADPMTSDVLPALRDAITLWRQLDQRGGEGGEPDDSLPFLAVADRLQSRLTKLDRVLGEWITKAISDPQNPTMTISSAKAILELPWLDWGQRRELRRIHSELEQTLSLDAVGSINDPQSQGRFDRTATTPSTGPLQRSSYDRITSWPIHPAVLTTQAEAIARPSDESEFDAVNRGSIPAESVMARIEQLGYLVRRSLGVWSGEGQTRPWEGPDSAMQEWLAAARWQRRCLPLASPNSNGVSPIEVVWRDAVHHLLLGQARRQLDGFYGTPFSSPGISPRRPLFDLACDQCVEVVALIGPPSREIQRDLVTLRKDQTLLQLASRSGIVTDVDTSRLPLDGEDLMIDVTLRPGKGSPTSSDALPPGRPSVWAQTERSELASDIGSFDFPIQQPQAFQLRATTWSPRLTALAMLRGNEFGQPFVVNRLGGTWVDYRPHRHDVSTITLSGQRRKRASIVFVLDCSRSMESPLPAESSSQAGPSRMDLAKSALATMLDELSQQDGARVGVVFFGHRVAWTRSDPPRISLSPGASVDIPEGLMPSEDVELILPLGRFDSGRVLQRLDSVQPWGQTPLYRSLIEAIRAFENDDPDTERQIVVITDGQDYQFTPSRSDIRQPRKTTQNEVLGLAQENSVPIFLLGFGLPDGERAAAEATFQTIASATGGEAISIDDGAELLRRLRERLAPGTFTVGDTATVSGDRTLTATLNGTVTVDPRQLDEGNVLLVFESAAQKITLEGGEALQIALSPDGRSFLPIPFQWQFPQTADLVNFDSGRQTAYRVRAHRPQRIADAVWFPISIQSTIDAVTVRPRETWTCVTPMIAGVEDLTHRYWFYDTNFEPDQPVPLLNWEADQWPTAATAARITFWCKFDATPPKAVFPLSEVVDSARDFVDRRLPDFPSVRMQVSVTDGGAEAGQFVVRVILRHEAGSNDLVPLRVSFESPEAIRPTRVRHQFDPTNRLSSHSFFFDASDSLALQRSKQSRIVLTSRIDAQSGALVPVGGQGIDVEIHRAADVIMLDPPR